MHGRADRDVPAARPASCGDAHIIRNAGGLATEDAIRSLAISQRVLGTEEVVVVMHDGCGLHGASEDEFTQQLADDGAHPSWRMGAFADVEATLRHSLERLRRAPELLHRDHIRGFVFDPETGTLREVDAALNGRAARRRRRRRRRAARAVGRHHPRPAAAAAGR